ncbi:hypothetical protein [Sphingomicrobium marinum]|uniref:hypothetical protein n=1 Tax=Sphingomicrobium marinum TaxID=1227950 RepID=UPI00223FF7CF|nr:hypothetical protein [Sphingomicrobium marinum]
MQELRGDLRATESFAFELTEKSARAVFDAVEEEPIGSDIFWTDVTAKEGSTFTRVMAAQCTSNTVLYLENTAGPQGTTVRLYHRGEPEWQRRTMEIVTSVMTAGPASQASD